MNKPNSTRLPQPFAKAARALKSITLALIILLSHHASKACSPLNVPTLLSQTITGGNLVLNWESNTTYICNGYYVQVEIVCEDAAFAGVAPFYASPSINKTATPFPFPTQTVSLGSLCPGKTYKFRAREVYPPGTYSGWTQTFTFATTGVFAPPTLSLTSTATIICPPQTVTLNAQVSGCGNPAQYTYAWSPAANLSNPNVASPTATTSGNITYICIVTGGALGCWSVSSVITLDVSTAPPQVGQAAAAPLNICVGKTATLTLPNTVGNVQWQTGSGSSGPWTNISGAVYAPYPTGPLTGSTCFRAIVSSCTNTLSSNVVCINPNTPPVLTPSLNPSNCNYTLATASFTEPGTSGAPSSVTWAPVPSSVNTTSTIASFTYAGPASATVTFPDGCVSTVSFNILPLPPTPTFAIVNASGSSSITCYTPVVILNAASNYTYGTINYFWASNTATSSSSSATVASGPSTIVTTGTDPLTFCASTKTTVIGVNTVAPVSAVNPTFQNITCTTTAANVTATAISPALNFTHIITSPLGGIFGGTSTSITVPIGSPGTYTYCLLDLINGCSTCKQFTVYSNQGFPTFSVTSPQSFTLGCTTKSVATINIINAATQPIAGGPVSYTLLGPSSAVNYGTGTLSTYTTAIPGTYTVITKDNTTLCQTKVPISILSNTLGPRLDTLIVPRDNISCATPTITLEGLSSTSNIGYNWSFPGATGNLPGSTITVFNNTLSPTTTLVATYTLTITDNGSTCKTTTMVTIYQNKYPPKAVISNGGVNAISCKTPTVMLTNVSSTGIPNGSYFPNSGIVQASFWDPPSPEVPLTNSSTYLASTVGQYTMTATDTNNGCTSTTVISIADNRVYPKVNDPIAPGDFVLDCGATSTSISPIINGDLSAFSYKWYLPPGAKTNSDVLRILLVDSPGEYQIIVTNTVNGCATPAFVHVVNGTLQAGITPDKIQGFAPLTVTVTNDSRSTLNNSGVITAWNFGNGTFSLTPQATISPVTIYSQAGTYSVIAFVTKGPCVDTVVKVISVELPSVLEIPNVFTPNDDGVNDIFRLKTASLTYIWIQVYDRWGHKVYELESDKGNIAWDGKNQQGRDVAEGTYMYVLKARGADERDFEVKGNISVFR